MEQPHQAAAVTDHYNTAAAECNPVQQVLVHYLHAFLPLLLLPLCDPAKHLSLVKVELSKVQRRTRHIIGHFGDESSQAINYTGTDNEKVTN